jgi:hypothetical protein
LRGAQVGSQVDRLYFLLTQTLYFLCCDRKVDLRPTDQDFFFLFSEESNLKIKQIILKNLLKSIKKRYKVIQLILAKKLKLNENEHYFK